MSQSSQLPSYVYRGNELIVSILLSLGAACVCWADDPGSDKTFHAAIQQIALMRSTIKSYDVTISGEVHNTNERIHTTDGKVHEVERIPVRFTLKIAFHRDQSRLRVDRQTTYRETATGEIKTKEWESFARITEPLAKGAKWESDGGRLFGSAPQYFDPLALGLFFEAEFRRGDPLDAIIENYSSWTDGFKRKRLADGKVHFEHDDYSTVIDTSRDYWPVAMSKGSLKQIVIKTDVTLGKFHERWLPRTATVVLPNETNILTFDWHSVNQPISPDRFVSVDNITQ